MALKGFNVVTVPMGNVTHQLFLKEHSATSSGVLFVGNVDLTLGMSFADIDSYLRDLLGGFGDITGVSVSSNRKDGEDKGKKRALDGDEDEEGGGVGGDEGGGGGGVCGSGGGDGGRHCPHPRQLTKDEHLTAHSFG